MDTFMNEEQHLKETDSGTSNQLTHLNNGGNSNNGSTPKGKLADNLNLGLQTPIKNGNRIVSSLINPSTAIVAVTPSKRLHRVRNPFETSLAERLHLPLIGSPSLFQHPTTPQMSSTQFEWTIDEVSSLLPANVEPHETQFYCSPNPEYEAKAQLAISTYFKEHKIVPSPVDCPLRQQRIILSELNSNTPISKPGRRIRDCSVQTELTLPVQLPPALEEALRPYFQPQLANNEDYTAMVNAEIKSNLTSTHDTSLRRKLFDMHNIVVLDGVTPQKKNNVQSLDSDNNSKLDRIVQGERNTAIVTKLSDSLDKSSFGSLSPISITSWLSGSPYSGQDNTSKRRSRLEKFLQDMDIGEVSPIPTLKAPRSRKILRACSLENGNYRVKTDDMHESTVGDINTLSFDDQVLPNCSYTKELQANSINGSFNFKISNLLVSSFKRKPNTRRILRARSVQNLNTALYNENEVAMESDNDEDEKMSQLSTSSLNYSSPTSDTMRSRRRSVNRKNLSQSFSSNWLEELETEHSNFVDNPTTQSAELQDVLMPCNNTVTTYLEPVNVLNTSIEQVSSFYRTDSGFNEMTTTNTSNSSAFKQNVGKHKSVILTNELTVVGCSSTPTKRRRLSSN